jgi:hypothetical protein
VGRGGVAGFMQMQWVGVKYSPCPKEQKIPSHLKGQIPTISSKSHDCCLSEIIMTKTSRAMMKAMMTVAATTGHFQ